MAIEQAVWFAIRDRRKRIVLYVGDQIRGVLDMCCPDCGVAHDRRRVLERIADLAIGRTESVRRIGECGSAEIGLVGFAATASFERITASL